MPALKECFGQLANMSIRFRDHSKQHFLRVDEEKLKECDTCPLFTKCMFLKYNDLMKEMLKLLDERKGSEVGTRL
ncbi:MAG: hypothetical protein K1Y02_13640 [Candidatus Hydrogenedentes bacterium]|nr:hypothetical protein [Candidatus Hydrogenedentota bacterium]